MSVGHNFWRERRTEAESNRGPSVYQPNALPLGQIDSLNRGVSRDCCFTNQVLLFSSLAGTAHIVSLPHSSNFLALRLKLFSPPTPCNIALANVPVNKISRFYRAFCPWGLQSKVAFTQHIPPVNTYISTNHNYITTTHYTLDESKRSNTNQSSVLRRGRELKKKKKKKLAMGIAYTEHFPKPAHNRGVSRDCCFTNPVPPFPSLLYSL